VEKAARNHRAHPDPECPILVFDDSLSAVDTETDSRIRSELAQRRKRATTFIISHRIATLSEADKILVVEDADHATGQPYGFARTRWSVQTGV
jgi:ABC-type multidrug transport system fused ATPase/permease subunit